MALIDTVRNKDRAKKSLPVDARVIRAALRPLHYPIGWRRQRLQVNKPGRCQNLQPLHKLGSQFVGGGIVLEPGRIVRIRSSAVKFGRTVSSISFSRNAASYFPRPSGFTPENVLARLSAVVLRPAPDLTGTSTHREDYRSNAEQEDIQALHMAVATLEHPRLAARLAEIAGKPIELFTRALPDTASKAIALATTQALNAALRVALRTMENEPKTASSYLHKVLAATSGAVGGSFGLAALPLELPISTVIMLRSIGDIARAEGEDLHDPETALSCLQVFALGGSKGELDAANSGYFAVRGLLAKSVAEAARFIVDRGVVAEGGPVLVRLIAQIASRFGVVVTQKLAAQAVPVIGALGGAAVNYAFIDHFQEVARAHFTVRRLERRYGKDAVRMAYDKLSAPHQRPLEVGPQSGRWQGRDSIIRKN